MVVEQTCIDRGRQDTMSWTENRFIDDLDEEGKESAQFKPVPSKAAKVLGIEQGQQILENVTNILTLSKTNHTAPFKAKSKMSRTDQINIDPVLCDCVSWILEEGIQTVGIFRVVGHSRTVELVLKAYEDKTVTNTTFVDLECDAHDIATAILRRICLLPTPLISASAYKALISAVKKSSSKSKEENLVTTICSIVVRSSQGQTRVTLAFLLRFFSIVAQLSHVNEMTPQSLAYCVGPYLIRSPNSGKNVDPKSCDIATTAQIMQILIENAEAIPMPTVPSSARKT